MKLRGVLAIALLFAVFLTASAVSAKQKKMTDYQCGAGGDATYKGNTDPYDSYPFSPAYDIHPNRADACYDNGETLFPDPKNMVHPDACYSPNMETDKNTTGFEDNANNKAEELASKKPDLDPYVCGRNTRFATVDGYCSYVGLPAPAVGDSYVTVKKKIAACLQVYIPEYAQMADRGQFILDTRSASSSSGVGPLLYGPLEVIDDPSNPGQKLATKQNLCYTATLTKGKNPTTGAVEPLNSELVDAFGHGATQQRVFPWAPNDDQQEIARIRDACHMWSPRHNYRYTDTTKGNALADFFGYQNGRCGNWYGESHDSPRVYNGNLNKDRMDILAMRLYRFDEYFFQNFDFNSFTKFCVQPCPKLLPPDQNCEDYRKWLKQFYIARNLACPILERNYSDVIPPPFIFTGSSPLPNLAAFSARWIFEEPNINAIAPITSDPGIVTKDSDGNPQRKKSKELLIGSAFKGGVDDKNQADGKDTKFPPFPAPTIPKYSGYVFSSGGARAAAITSAVNDTNNKSLTAADRLFQAPPDSTTSDDAGKLSVLQGVPGCDQGGAFELMLYQARCINWFGATCLCDYDKTFREGSDLNYVLNRAGAKIMLKTQKRNPDGTDATEPLSSSSGSQPATESFSYPWPMAWRGQLNNNYAKRFLKDQPSLSTGLAAAEAGDIIIWRNVSGVPKHVAYVERVSWDEQCTPNTVKLGNNPGDRIEISEMNNGKFRDICGNTDLWGQVTERTLNQPLTVMGPLPDGSSSDCTNSDAVNCRETNWDKIEVYNPRLSVDTTPDANNPELIVKKPQTDTGSGGGTNYGTNVWGKWDTKTQPTEGVKLDDKPDQDLSLLDPPTTCDLPDDFNCGDKSDKESADAKCPIANGKYTYKYTPEQKKKILRRRQNWAWGKVKLCPPGQTSGCEDKIEDCTSGKPEDCCAYGSGYRCLIGCDPPVGLREHEAKEQVFASISLDDLQGRAPLTGPDAVINMSTRSCPMFPDTFYSKDPFPCKRACGAGDTHDKNDESYVAPACPVRPGGCPQGLKPGKEMGCLGSSSTPGGTAPITTHSASIFANINNNTPQIPNNIGSAAVGDNNINLPQCTTASPSSDSSCASTSCPPRTSCDWTSNAVYSEKFIEARLGGTSDNPVSYLPYVDLQDPTTGQTTHRIQNPANWLTTESSPLWSHVILGSSKNINSAQPQQGDIAVIINSRYCTGQAAQVTSVTTDSNGNPCFALQSTNWQQACDKWEDGSCWQSCSATSSPAAHTNDALFQNKSCLTRDDLGPTGYIFRP